MSLILVKLLSLTSWMCVVVTGQFSFNYTKCNNNHCLLSDGFKTTNIYEARRKCKAKQTWLLEIYNADTTSLFSSFMTENGIFTKTQTYEAFLNMNKDLSSWIWLNKKEIGGLEVHNQQEASKLFVTLSKTKENGQEKIKYQAFVGNSLKNMICQNITGSCKSTTKAGCYFPMREQVNWYEASNACIGRGMVLATFESMRDDEISNVLYDMGENEQFWIGLLRKPFQWNHQKTFVSYTKWSSNYPDSNSNNPYTICPHIKKDFTWSLFCQSIHAPKIVVCMRDKLNSTPIPTPTTTTDSIGNNPGLVTPNNFTKPSESSLSTGAKAGIGVGVLLILLIALIIFLFWKFKPKIPISIPKKLRFSSKSSTINQSINQSTSSTLAPSTTSPAVDEAKEPTVPIYVLPITKNHVEYAELAELPVASNSESAESIDDDGYERL